VELTRDLAAALAAAWLDRRSYHHDLCSGECGGCMSSLLADLVAVLLPGFAEAAAVRGLEGKPFWPEDHPDLLPQRVPAVAA
jgi:hypothetical protein